VTAGDVGFKLGPRINAAGRLEDAAVAVRLLLADDLAEANRLAERLDRANSERQELQGRIADEAQVLADKLGSPEERRVIIVSASGWHAGVVGIVASRLVERLHRPALVLVEEDGLAKGSGRSVEGFHLYDALAVCAPYLTRFGGHKHAAGLTLELGKLAAFSAAFEEHARRVLDVGLLEPRVRIDARLQASELTLALAHELQRLAPFGAGNPEPVFACEGLNATEVRVLKDKRGAGPGHLKVKFAGAKGAKVDAIGFSMGGRTVAPGSALGAAFQLGVDTWSGVEKVQLKLKDVRVG
jgi:single-stranded-DNA-specific exonuclease